MISVLPNVMMELSSVRKKKREPLNVIKSTVKCDVGIVECDYGTIKCEKKNTGTTKCDKRKVTYDIKITQCEDETVKCKKKYRNCQM